MSRLLFFSVPLAAAGVSSWRWYVQWRRPPDPPPVLPAEPVYIPSRLPPLEADDTAISRPASVLQLHARPLARLRAGDACQRRGAIAALAQLDELTAADCQQLGQTLDYRSALLLANWASTDLRLFLPPRGTVGTPAAPLELRLRLLLESLPPGPACAEFWRARALRHPPAADWEPAPLSADAADVGAPPPWRSAPAQAVETDCLRALLERTDSPRQVQAMLEGGVLDLLAAAHAQRPRDASRCGLIARILSGFPSVSQLYQSGWLGLLAAWSHEPDIRTGPAAWRVIRNLTLAEELLQPPVDPSPDPSDAVISALVAVDSRWSALRSRAVIALRSLGWIDADRPAPKSPRKLRPLPDGVLVLHPRSLAAEAATDVDLVLVHGLLGGTDRTWRQSDAVREALPPPAEPSLSEIVLRRNVCGKEEEERSGRTREKSVGPAADHSRRGGAGKDSGVSARSVDGASAAGGRDFNSTGSSVSNAGQGKDKITENRSVNFGNSRMSNSNENSNSKARNGDASTSTSGESFGGSDSNLTPTNIPGSGTCEPYTQCWPRDWLPADLLPLRVRVISVDYDSAWSDWRPRCAARRARSLADRASELRRRLTEAGVGERPVVWLAHSMGGLLVKQLLVEVDREAMAVAAGAAGGSDSSDGCAEVDGDQGGDGVSLGGREGVMTLGGSSSTGRTINIGGRAVHTGGGAMVASSDGSPDSDDIGDDSRRVVDNSDRSSADRTTRPFPVDPLLSSTVGVLLLSCPNAGSRLASSLSGALRPILLPSAELDALRQRAPGLLELREAFVALCRRRGVKCLSVAETRPLPLLGRRVLFVEPDSADAGVGRLVRVDESHLGVCKPRDRSSEVYQLVVEFVREVCEGL